MGCTDGAEATARGKKQDKDLWVVQNTQESRKGRNSKSETVAEGISPMASSSEMWADLRTRIQRASLHLQGPAQVPITPFLALDQKSSW